MPRYVIDEGMIGHFVRKVSDKIAQGQKNALDKAFANDPELRRLTAELEKSQQAMRNHIRKNRLDKKTQKEVDRNLNNPKWFEFDD